MKEKKTHEVVITGIAGAFPECLNVEEFEKAVLNGENLVRDNPRHFTDTDIPLQLGSITNSQKFDSHFFGIHNKLSDVMDISAKQLLERTYEAIWDSGNNPLDFYGTNTPVIVANGQNESEFQDKDPRIPNNHAIVGRAKAMMPNRISYAFGLTGSSYLIEASWVGGITALKIAKDLIQKGQAKQVVVGCTSLIQTSAGTFHYSRHGLNVLNEDGKTKCFSADADGYTRAEAAVVFFLQRQEDALRSYGTIEKLDAYLPTDYSLPLMSYRMFDSFTKEFYENAGIDLDTIGYFEATGSANLVTDAIELNALAKHIYPKRTKPLLVGSSKSIVGHGEESACFMAIVNGLVALKSGQLPLTINYSKPNPNVPALQDGRMKIVTEKTPLIGDRIAVSCVGLNGYFGHVIIKRNPCDTPGPVHSIPTLVCLSGKDAEKMKANLESLVANPVDVGFVKLLHNIMKTEIPNHLYRGYTLIQKDEAPVIRKYEVAEKRQLWFVFSGMGSQWPEMGRDIMKFSVASKSIQKSHEILKSKGLDLINIILNPDPSVFNNILHSFVGIAAIQIALVDLIRELGIVPDGIVGHSVGELGCSYADGCLTAEQVILAAYYRGKASNDAKLIKGMMAAIGKGYKDIIKDLPSDIEVACHNSSVSCTLSGPAESMEAFVKVLKGKGVFAKLVNVANIAYHSKHIAPAAPYLLKYLKEVIPSPKKRSSKWISSSVPEHNWDSPLARYCSAEYHTNNLTSYVLFEEATAHIPDNAVTIEIAPHGLLQAIVKRSLPNCINISLTNRMQSDGVKYLLNSLGMLFITGVDMNLSALYSEIEFPVSRSTKYLHPMVTWDHRETWTFIGQKELDLKESETEASFSYNKEDKAVQHLMVNYLIKNEPVIPRANILHHVIELYCKVSKKDADKVPILFNNIDFHFDIPLNENYDSVQVSLLHDGEFEVLSNDKNVVKGSLKEISNSSSYINSHLIHFQPNGSLTSVTEDEFYQFMKENQFHFGNFYRNVRNVTISATGFEAIVSWRGQINYFLDSIFSLILFYSYYEEENHILLDKISYIAIDPSEFTENERITVQYNKRIGAVVSKGFTLMHFRGTSVENVDQNLYSLQKRVFLPFETQTFKNERDFYSVCSQFIYENILKSKDKTNILNLVSLYGNTQRSIELGKAVSSEESWEVKDKLLSLDELMGETEVNTDIGNVGYVISYQGVEVPSQMLYFLNNRKGAFLVLYTEPNTKLQLPGDMTKVFEIQSNNFIIYLIKKNSSMFGDSNIILAEQDGWKQKLKDTLAKTSEPVYLVSYKELFSEIADFYENVTNLFTSDLLKFIFIDSASPRFNLKLQLYQEQLKKEFRINVIRNSVWGSLRNVPIPEKVFENVTDEVFIKKLQCENIQLEYISLNLEDNVNPLEDPKLGVLEYAGHQGSEPVFGIGTLGPLNELKRDPHFLWKIPNGWTPQEAATVPLYYSLAYYIIHVLGRNQPGDTVLIHAGYTHIAHATMRVAMQHGCKVYTTYFTPEQKAEIVKEFPKIPEDQIICCNTFFFQIMKHTNGVGVHTAVNFLGKEFLTSTAYSVTTKSSWSEYMGGICVQVGREPADINQKLGMDVFRNSIAVQGCCIENILTWDTSLKEKINECLNAGIKSRVVKPFKFTEVAQLPSKKHAAQVVATQFRMNSSQKVIINLKNHKNGKLLGKTKIQNHKSNLVIGNNFGLWYELLSWLASKSVEKCFLFANVDDIPPCFSRRFKNFLKKHPNTAVEVFSLKGQKHNYDWDDLIESIQKKADLQDIYFDTTGLEVKEVSSIDLALRRYAKDSTLYCIGDSANRVFDWRKEESLKCIALMPDKNLRSKDVVGALEKLYLYKDRTMDVIYLNEANKNADISVTINSYLPTDMNELIDLGYNSSIDICFKEVRTHGAPYRYNRECNPIFAIPGFKINKMSKLISNLPYATYMAHLPEEIHSIEELAEMIAQNLLDTFNLKLYNLLCEGWSGCLTLMVARNLEARGRSVVIFMIDGEPSTVQEVMKNITDLNIICKYISLSPESYQEVSKKSSWKDKLETCLKETEFSEMDANLLRTSLNSLMSRIKMQKNLNLNFCLERSRGFLFRSGDLTKVGTLDHNTQHKNFVKPLNIIFKNSANLFSDTSVAHEIGLHSLYEYEHISDYDIDRQYPIYDLTDFYPCNLLSRYA